jgi:serine/threonine protein kinase
MDGVVWARPTRFRYVLVERLGRGGAAETWRARREGGLVVQEVCVKRPILPLEAQQRRAFVEEARLLARIRDRHVVSLIDVAEDESGMPLLVLELVDGADLSRVISAMAEANLRFTACTVAAVGVAVCRALHAAQRAMSQGFAHRDVTPHNILVSLGGELKLADFGIARAFDRERWTRAGLVKGKTSYVSPEQIRGEELDARSDLFALGVVLYEILAGSRPFVGDGRLGTLRAIQLGERLPVARLAPHAPQALLEAIERLLATRREERPASAREAAQTLEALADDRAAAGELASIVRALRGPGLHKAVPRRSMRVDLGA